MRHKEVWKRLGAWTLAFSMVAGSCPSMALAEEADQQIVDVEEFSDHEQAGEVSQAEEMPSGETSVEDVEDVPEDSRIRLRQHRQMRVQRSRQSLPVKR